MCLVSGEWCLVKNRAPLTVFHQATRPPDHQTPFTVMREYVWLECTETGMRNYRVQKETRGTERLELKKYCPKLRRHTVHKESRKK